jgi:hypothetical protein
LLSSSTTRSFPADGSWPFCLLIVFSLSGRLEMA